jgi:hypothetical protein
MPRETRPDHTAALVRLKDLHDRGVLTDEEFTATKQRLLSEMGLANPTDSYLGRQDNQLAQEAQDMTKEAQRDPPIRPVLKTIGYNCAWCGKRVGGFWRNKIMRWDSRSIYFCGGSCLEEFVQGNPTDSYLGRQDNQLAKEAHDIAERQVIAVKRPWWQQGVAIAWAMILVFPLGILLMWLYAPWRGRFKWIWTGVAAFAALVIIGAAIPSEEKDSSATVSPLVSATQEAPASAAPAAATSEPGTPTPDATIVAGYVEAVATQQAEQQIAQYVQAVATQQAEQQMARYIDGIATSTAEQAAMATREAAAQPPPPVSTPAASPSGITEIWQKCRLCPSGFGLTTDLTYIAMDLVDSLQYIVTKQLHPSAAIIVIYVTQDTQREMFGSAPVGMPGKWGDHFPVAAILVDPFVEPPWDYIEPSLDNKAVLCWATDQFLSGYIYMALKDPGCLLGLGSSTPGDWLEPYSPTR